MGDGLQMKVLKVLIALLLAIVLLVGGYVGYLFISYDRLPDSLALEIDNSDMQDAEAGREIDIVSWNLGFGAYVSDYSFFMDGGEESRVRSEADVYKNIGAMADALKEIDADIMLLQEVDIDATRSHHVDESMILKDALPDYAVAFAQNYDSSYLFYPFLKPHGASRSGMLAFSNLKMESAVRRSLPVETGIMKFFDLDRCYAVHRIPVDNGKTLCLYNLHLSAYTSDGTIADEQIRMLAEDMSAEYAAGNYVVAGGDFNKDLYGNSPAVFGVSGEAYTWAQPIPEGIISLPLEIVDSLNEDNPVPSCRNADKPYIPGESFVLTVDGFIVSDNVAVKDCHVVDAGFEYSDHNPVFMRIVLE